MGPAADELDALIECLQSSKIDKAQSLSSLQDLMHHIIHNNVPSAQHWGVSMTIAAHIRKLKRGS